MEASEWELIHGEVNGPTGIARMGHAWLEFDGWAYDPVLDTVMRANVYAFIHKAVVHEKYSCVQAANKAIETGHLGPWGKLRVVAGSFTTTETIGIQCWHEVLMKIKLMQVPIELQCVTLQDTINHD
jgi:hypothetical protein